MDTRTLWEQHPWSCSLLPNAPSLQSLCEERESIELVPLRALTSASFWKRRNLCCQSWSHPGRKQGQTHRGMTAEACSQTGKYLNSIHCVQWLMFTGYLSSGSYTRFFYAQRPKQKTAASENSLNKVYNSLCHAAFLCSSGLALRISHLLAWFAPSSSNLLIIVCWVQC